MWKRSRSAMPVLRSAADFDAMACLRPRPHTFAMRLAVETVRCTSTRIMW